MGSSIKIKIHTREPSDPHQENGQKKLRCVRPRIHALLLKVSVQLREVYLQQSFEDVHTLPHHRKVVLEKAVHAEAVADFGSFQICTTARQTELDEAPKRILLWKERDII